MRVRVDNELLEIGNRRSDLLRIFQRKCRINQGSLHLDKEIRCFYRGEKAVLNGLLYWIARII